MFRLTSTPAVPQRSACFPPMPASTRRLQGWEERWVSYESRPSDASPQQVWWWVQRAVVWPVKSERPRPPPEGEGRTKEAKSPCMTPQVPNIIIFI